MIKEAVALILSTHTKNNAYLRESVKICEAFTLHSYYREAIFLCFCALLYGLWLAV